MSRPQLAGGLSLGSLEACLAPLGSLEACPAPSGPLWARWRAESGPLQLLPLWARSRLLPLWASSPALDRRSLKTKGGQLCLGPLLPWGRLRLGGGCAWGAAVFGPPAPLLMIGRTVFVCLNACASLCVPPLKRLHSSASSWLPHFAFLHLGPLEASPLWSSSAALDPKSLTLRASTWAPVLVCLHSSASLYVPPFDRPSLCASS